MVDEGDDEKFRGFESSQNSSQSVCLGLFVYGFCWLAFQESIP
jgi:hypothetical protein